MQTNSGLKKTPDNRPMQACSRGPKEMVNIKSEIKDLIEGEIRFDEPMSGHTSLKIGGPVDIMVFPEDPASLKNVLVAAQTGGLPLFFFGAGTNLLVDDRGIEGIAVSLKKFNSIDMTRGTDEFNAVVHVGSGVPMAQLMSTARINGLSGLEPLAGIPGYVGGAVFMNAGSFGREMKDVILSVAIMDREGQITMLKKDDIGFSYRYSQLPDNSVILSATIKLVKDEPEKVEKRIKDYMARKKKTQPLGEFSAGCVFKNPEGDSAGLLIDQAGCKGMRVGEIEVSTKHANYFINRGSGTFTDFMKLMETVRAKVLLNQGVDLESEIIIIGKDRQG